ncbi:DAO-domain-containing protein [Boletus edulis BED1]|uniref:Glycerol-3-phosphate dehydrogenase n=1 Tax=Boletus edulis BED1 TaxID=1328754 RepID=A0AAD4GGZ8_BOLED|nr:DAO-domain-containing protein [Boletus edulis BED1]
MATLRRLLFSRRTLVFTAASTLGLAGGGYYYLNAGPVPYPASTRETRRPPPVWTPPSRQAMLDALERSASPRAPAQAQARGEEEDVFDLLIVGGGATGAGVAVDAASRGLSVALVERNDFSSGTSSKSTKLVHGGVRYLQKAVTELDYEQYKLVREALRERRIFLHTAPYLSHMLPIMLPLYKYWQVPYYYAGCKMYDVLAGKENMESSYLMSKGKALEMFPMLKREGLVGAVVYYDGQHNDARMNVALIMTAVQLGATVANYCGVTELHKDDQGKLIGAKVKDELTGREFNVRAKGIINATGPYTDSLLSLDDPSHKPIVRPSSGVHITLPAYYAPARMGLLDPATSDGRVIFFLPWEGGVVAGTTDTPAKVNAQGEEVTPTEEDVRWVIDEVRGYLSPDIKVRRGDVLSAWAGLRPLISSGSEGGTEGLVRNHLARVEPSGLITIAGGKWTTYRAMAEETVDKAIQVFGLQDKVKGGCRTAELRLIGSDGWSQNMFIGLVQRFGLDTDVAKQLSENYGDRAWTVCALAELPGEQWPVHGVRLSPSYPYVEAEVLYAARHEYACTAVDVLARRTRLAFVDVQAALVALPRVIEIMSRELGWSRARQKVEYARGMHFLASMGLAPGSAVNNDTTMGARTWWTWFEGGFWRLIGLAGVSTPSRASSFSSFKPSYSRTKFDAGEVDALRELFDRRVATAASSDASSSAAERLNKAEIEPALKAFAREWPGAGYEGFREADYRYVFAQEGLEDQTDVDFDEFVEICGNLKDVSMMSVAKVAKKERKRIPVEKSGGGV